MENIIFLGNILSAIGAFFLFAGYFLITIKNKEKHGVIFSGVGSFIMCFAFWILDSPAFLLLNVVWTMISIRGYMKRNTDEKEKTEPVPIKQMNRSLFAFFVLPGALFVFSGEHDIVSWFTISLMLLSYVLFAIKRMKRIDYIIFSIAANLLSLSHMYDIQNYSSLVQTIISILLSIYAIIDIDSKEKFLDISAENAKST